MEEVINRNLWNFELGSQESMNGPIWIFFGFQQEDRKDSQNVNSDTFCRLPVTSAQCFTGTEKYPEASILLNYDDDDYSQVYGMIKEAYRILTKDDILQPCKSDHVFTPSNVRADDVGYNLNVFDIRYQQIFTASQSSKVKFEYHGVVPNDLNGYSLVLTNKLVSVISDGQRHFYLI